MSRSLRLGILALLPADHPLPWRAGDNFTATCGCILDDGGEAVARIDPAIPVEAQNNLAQALVLAINTVTGHDTASTVALVRSGRRKRLPKN